MSPEFLTLSLLLSFVSHRLFLKGAWVFLQSPAIIQKPCPGGAVVWGKGNCSIVTWYFIDYEFSFFFFTFKGEYRRNRRNRKASRGFLPPCETRGSWRRSFASPVPVQLCNIVSFECKPLFGKQGALSIFQSA